LPVEIEPGDGQRPRLQQRGERVVGKTGEE